MNKVVKDSPKEEKLIKKPKEKKEAAHSVKSSKSSKSIKVAKAPVQKEEKAKSSSSKASKKVEKKQKRTSKKENKKDPNRIKKPLSAYMLFCNEERANVKKEFPEKSLGEISKVLGERWKSLDDSRKKQFIEQQAQLKLEYEQKLKAVAE